MALTDQELREAFEAAKRAGDFENAYLIEQQLNGSTERVGPLQTSDRGEMERRWKALGHEDKLFPPSEASAMSGPERVAAALDYGLEKLPYGAAQLAAHLTPGVDPSRMDEIVNERARMYEQGGLADYTEANLAQMAGEIAGFAMPGSAAYRAAQASKAVAKLPTMLRAGATGASAGAGDAALMPVVGEDYVGGKLAQVGLGAGLGAGLGMGVEGITDMGMGVVNAPRHAKNAPVKMMDRARTNPRNADFAQEGARLKDRTGVDLTIGQETGSIPATFIEQRARESFHSSQRAFDADMFRANQFKAYLENITGPADSATFASALQGKLTNFVTDLAKSRSDMGRKMYGEIDRLAGNQKIVQPRNFYDELVAIVEEAGTRESGDVAKAAKKAKQILDNIDKQGGYTAQEALGRLQDVSPYSKASLFRKVNQGYDAELKRKLYSALMKDLDETAGRGGSVGKMVREANDTWRQYSDQIDGIQKSALGKMVGDEFANDLMNFNTVAPEQIMGGFMKLLPSQAKYVAELLYEHMPDQADGLFSAFMRDAMDGAMELPATGGAQINFSPAQWLRELGLKGGGKGGEAYQRLMHLSGGEGSERWALLRDAINVARRLSDASGRNFSGTSQAMQWYEALKVLSGNMMTAAKKAGSTGLERFGLRRIADSMHPQSATYGNLNQLPLIQKPRVIQAAPGAASIFGTVPAVSGNQ